jgi:hypothetical protein
MTATKTKKNYETSSDSGDNASSDSEDGASSDSEDKKSSNYNESDKKITFTEEEKSKKEEFYWKLLHYKLFGEFYGIKMKNTSSLRTERTCMDKYFGVNSDDYLIKNEFDFKGEPEFYKLWEYLKDNENVILAGGYMTSMLFGIDFFSNSDIDLFVRKDRVMDVIDFVRYNFNIVRYEKLCSLVVNIVLDGMRNIQIIAKDFDKVSHLLDDFDMCHSKCAFYMGDTYHTYDAKYTKENKITMSFQNVRVDRSIKAAKYGLKLFNRSLCERAPKGEEEFVNYYDYDFRDSNEFHLNLYSDETKIKNIIVVSDKYDLGFFRNFGSSYNHSWHNHYNFEYYQFTDKILYEEINLNNVETLDLTDIIKKSTRYNFSHYCNFYKMVPFNEYFKVPCILYFTTQVDYDTVNMNGIEYKNPYLIGVKNYKNMLSKMELLFRKIRKHGYITESKKSDNYPNITISYNKSKSNRRCIETYHNKYQRKTKNDDEKSYGYTKDINIQRSLKYISDGELGAIKIESMYNDVKGIENKTSEKLCLIFLESDNGPEFGINFNLFPSSVNF